MDDLARLESIAQQLIARLRDDDPERTWAWLASEMPDPSDWFRLCFVLAAAVPDNQTWRWLTAWTYGPVDREEHRREYARNWMRRKRAREAA